MKPYAARELAWAEIAMKLDLAESGIARASTCHGYFVRDGITPQLLATLQRIAEEART